MYIYNHIYISSISSYSATKHRLMLRTHQLRLLFNGSRSATPFRGMSSSNRHHRTQTYSVSTCGGSGSDIAKKKITISLAGKYRYIMGDVKLSYHIWRFQQVMGVPQVTKRLVQSIFPVTWMISGL